MKKIIFVIIFIAALAVTFYLILGHEKITRFQDSSRSALEESQTTALVPLSDGIYTLAADESEISWGARSLFLQEKGLINPSTGVIEINNGNVSGFLTLDMASIVAESGDVLTDHLKSVDFFNVDIFPQARFDAKEYTEGRLKGDLTIKNVTQPVTFNLDVLTTGGPLVAKGSASIDRTSWGINFLSESVLAGVGDKAIKDTITFDVHLVAYPTVSI